MGEKTAENSGMNIDSALVRELADMLNDTNLTEIEVEEGSRKIRVSRAAPAGAYAMAPAPAAAAPAVGAQSAGTAPAEQAELPGTPVDAVKSPMVGTAYLSAEPGAAPFIAVGSKVKAGETLLIVEAMKVMNAIPAPRAGTVSQILVGDAEPVEFDQPLVVVD
ncbi:acetyl-CoA carboxylase biotin carboxyl carrier protein [uncultured Croceicoccus sp.]|uniref:acetyl-CoA carboxylase biotin carboxyl carrier protein n=1 Tax=uncultured Croceicoccus sp. TaxID=1295329 RepID=UPI002639C014|nr:acetyl-CoA carboxylase biotin carboxyl carrier protein [uncultured Croceicoccus sp.]